MHLQSSMVLVTEVIGEKGAHGLEPSIRKTFLSAEKHTVRYAGNYRKTCKNKNDN